MSTPSRSAQFAKVHKVLKKYYQPVPANADRPVLEHLLFGCCLENAAYAKAEEAYAALTHTFFDWNEIRVTTVKELSEVLAALPDPVAAATRVKRALQYVFESTYSFELEDLRKKNIGVAVEWLEKITAITRFVVAYVVQSGLGGHSIPIDSGALGVMRLLDLISDKDQAAGQVPGLERAIAKNKGVEFGSLLHQLGVEFLAAPHNPALHKILLQINPEIESRLPKRRPKPAKSEPAPAPAAGKSGAAAKGPAGKAAAASKPAEPAVDKGRRKKKNAAPEAAPPAPQPPAESKSPAARKPAATKKPPVEKKRPAAEPAAAGDTPSAKKASMTAGLSKRKPR